MRDDAEFNISLVKEIEECPCIYDNTRDDYSKRDVQEKAWEKIATKLGETAVDCKARWKNLRCRYLKIKNMNTSGAGPGRRKCYYLTEYMHFLDNSIASKQKRNIQLNASTSIDEAVVAQNSPPTQEQVEEIYINSVSSASESEPEMVLNEIDPAQWREETNRSTNVPSFKRQAEEKTDEDGSARKRKCYDKKDDQCQTQATIEEVNREALEYFKLKKQSAKFSSNRISLDDPDASFLLSIVPDMKKMQDKFKRVFKMKLLQLVYYTLDGQSSMESTYT